MKQILLSFCFLFTQILFAQDSVKQWRFEKQIDYWSKWQHHSTFAGVSMPSYIQSARRSRVQSIGTPTTFDSVTDNPLLHGATYIVLKTQTDFKNKIRLFADLYAEHRGVSYGIFNTDNTVLYPILRVEAKDTLKLFKNSMIISGQVGQFLDERLDGGLMVYNLDVQGFQISANYKKFLLQYTLYGDLYGGIGLNIDEANHFSVQKRLSDKDRIGLSVLVAKPPYAPLENNFNLNLFATKIFAVAEFYAQAAYRPFSASFFSPDFFKQSAFLTGIKISRQNKKFDHLFKAEARYYGFLFNFNYYNWDTVLYRKPATDIYSNYANTVGRYLYPLRKFETPFSQWAVFTEYTGMNILATSILGKSIWHLSKKFDAFINYDLNYIYAHKDKVFGDPSPRSSSFFYPFINTGISYLPEEIVSVSISFTNKAMNLDINYPTFYLLKKPCFQLSVSASFQ